MNRDEILDMFDGARDDYVLAAIASRSVVPKGRMGRRRLLLVAVAAAMALLLVGCGVAYVLKMQDLKLGDQKVTQERWDDESKTMVYETVQQQVLTFSGLKGTPSYEAAKEWYEFESAYDPDHSLYFQNDASETPWKKSAQYSAYNIYTQQMQDKIDEITEKYGLKLIGAPVRARSPKNLLSYLGMEHVFREDSEVFADTIGASFYEGGKFDIDMRMQLEDCDAWPYQFLCSLYYTPKDCFDDTLCELNEAQDWQEWNYTTASGDTVLVIRSPSVWVSWIFCDRGDATITLRMETILEWYSDDSVEKIPMPDEALKAVLDTFDFSIRPAPGDPALLEGVPASLDLSQTQNGYTVTVKELLTDGYAAKITLSITAPESVDLEQYLREDGPNLRFDSIRLSAPEGVDSVGGGGNFSPIPDNDCKANTVDYFLDMRASAKEGAPFPQGQVCNLFLQDLRVTQWNDALNQTDVLWEQGGTWNFDIPLENGNWRELEFIAEPVKTTASIGWREDGSDVFEEVTLTSLKIRAFSGRSQVLERSYAELCDYPADRLPKLVLTDGTEIRLRGDWVANDPEWAGKPLPLEEVEYLELMDGQKLSPVDTTGRQEDFSLEVRSAVTDGTTAQVVLGLTVPYWAEMCQENCGYSIAIGNFGNYNILMPMDRDLPSKEELRSQYALGETLEAREDGDGRDDTVEIVYTMYVDPGQDALAYFAPGSQWLVHIEGMEAERMHYQEGELTEIEQLWTDPGVRNVELTLEAASGTLPR